MFFASPFFLDTFFERRNVTDILSNVAESDYENADFSSRKNVTIIFSTLFSGQNARCVYPPWGHGSLVTNHRSALALVRGEML